jgi:hypothetical protein
MKKSVRVFSMFMVAIMTLSIGFNVFAAELDKGSGMKMGVAKECSYYLPQNSESSSEYFRFSNLFTRMNSNGSFTFSFMREMDSDSFKPKNSTMRVYATATSSNSNQTYYISLFKSSDNSLVQSVTYTANGNSQYYDFTGLSTSTRYYLHFSKPISSTATITGSGQINSIQ